jgi:transcription initiation factor IIF auxiliary subunit
VHLWEFFVGMEDPSDDEQYIDHVMVRLHPTFTPAAVVLQQPPFKVRRVSFGREIVPELVTHVK